MFRGQGAEEEWPQEEEEHQAWEVCDVERKKCVKDKRAIYHVQSCWQDNYNEDWECPQNLATWGWSEGLTRIHSWGNKRRETWDAEHRQPFHFATMGSQIPLVFLWHPLPPPHCSYCAAASCRQSPQPALLQEGQPNTQPWSGWGLMLLQRPGGGRGCPWMTTPPLTVLWAVLKAPQKAQQLSDALLTGSPPALSQPPATSHSCSLGSPPKDTARTRAWNSLPSEEARTAQMGRRERRRRRSTAAFIKLGHKASLNKFQRT